MDVVFRLDLPHGRCVGVAIPHDLPAAALATLPAEERAFAENLPPARRPSWIAGRVALRAALEDLGLAAGPILATDRGAPALPANAVGSISHKRTLAVGLAAPANEAQRGVDLEMDAPLKVDIARRVLQPDELAALVGVPAEARHREVLLRLSAKESIYKALDPFVRRHVSFQEAKVDLQPDGTAKVSLTLTGGEGPFQADVRWLSITPASFGPHFLTTALIARGAREMK